MSPKSSPDYQSPSVLLPARHHLCRKESNPAGSDTLLQRRVSPSAKGRGMSPCEEEGGMPSYGSSSVKMPSGREYKIGTIIQSTYIANIIVYEIKPDAINGHQSQEIHVGLCLYSPHTRLIVEQRSFHCRHTRQETPLPNENLCRRDAFWSTLHRGFER